MVEVFKTNVQDHNQANRLIEWIHNTYADYRANFDLDDCGKILRVECTTQMIQASLLIALLNDFGVYAEVLPDDDQALGRLLVAQPKNVAPKEIQKVLLPAQA